MKRLKNSIYNPLLFSGDLGGMGSFFGCLSLFALDISFLLVFLDDLGVGIKLQHSLGVLQRVRLVLPGLLDV